MSKENILNPVTYGSISYGVKPHPHGTLLKTEDVIKAIYYILDDDDLISDRLLELYTYLKSTVVNQD